jgi:hypothetical protein
MPKFVIERMLPGAGALTAVSLVLDPVTGE